jgi:hypothetical protein
MSERDTYNRVMSNPDQRSSAEYHEAHLAFARAHIVKTAALGAPILDLLLAYTNDVRHAERDLVADEERREHQWTGADDFVQCGRCGAEPDTAEPCPLAPDEEQDALAALARAVFEEMGGGQAATDETEVDRG